MSQTTSSHESRPGQQMDPGQQAAVAGDAVPAQIDLQALAQKIYALMAQELRIERERLGR